MERDPKCDLTANKPISKFSQELIFMIMLTV